MKENKQYSCEIILSTPDGDQNVTLNIILKSEDEYNQTVEVTTEYQNNKIRGQGKDYLWIDAFADFQRHMPDGVTVKCCLTCRYGNMCPYGNLPGEIFCLKEFAAETKTDVCNFFDNTERSEIKKVQRKYADCCRDYQQQSFDFYTYNDYLYELSK